MCRYIGAGVLSYSLSPVLRGLDSIIQTLPSSAQFSVFFLQLQTLSLPPAIPNRLAHLTKCIKLWVAPNIWKGRRKGKIIIAKFTFLPDSTESDYLQVPFIGTERIVVKYLAISNAVTTGILKTGVWQDIL